MRLQWQRRRMVADIETGNASHETRSDTVISIYGSRLLCARFYEKIWCHPIWDLQPSEIAKAGIIGSCVYFYALTNRMVFTHNMYSARLGTFFTGFLRIPYLVTHFERIKITIDNTVAVKINIFAI